MAKLIFDYNRTLFDPEKEKFFRNVVPMIKRLSLENDLYLLSLNEKGRENFFAGSAISKSFKKAYFVPKKTTSLIKKIANNDTSSIVIGDRITEEIKIGNILGLRTIRVLQGKFAKEIPSTDLETPTFIIKKVTDLEKLLKEL